MLTSRWPDRCTRGPERMVPLCSNLLPDETRILYSFHAATRNPTWSARWSRAFVTLMYSFVKCTDLLRRKVGVCSKGLENRSGQGSIELLKELKIHDANPIAAGGKTVPSRMGELLDQALGSKLARIVSERAHLILFDGAAERLHDMRE